MRSLFNNLVIVFGLVFVVYQNSPTFQSFTAQAVIQPAKYIESRVAQVVVNNAQEVLNGLGGGQL